MKRLFPFLLFLLLISCSRPQPQTWPMSYVTLYSQGVVIGSYICEGVPTYTARGIRFTLANGTEIVWEGGDYLVSSTPLH